MREVQFTGLFITDPDGVKVLPRYFQQARAKVNLFLEVVGRRNDGYHDIVSVFQEIDLEDLLSAQEDEPGSITLECDDPGLSCQADNLVIKAARCLQEAAGIRDGIRFNLQKRIPAGAGLGGGSSDAAAALRLACKVWGLRIERNDLARIGARVGSDVPFFLWGGTCLCEGRGEKVTPLADAVGLDLILVMPEWRSSTATAFKALAGAKLGTRDPDVFLLALQAGDLAAIAENSFNRFEETIFRLEPRQKTLHQECIKAGATCVRLSGSGSAAWCMPGTNGAKIMERLSGINGVHEVIMTRPGSDPGYR